MAVALAVVGQVASAVTAGGERTAVNLYATACAPFVTRVFQADDPRAAVTPRGTDVQVAAKVQQHRTIGRLGEHQRGAVDSVFLTDAAEIDLHASRQSEDLILPAHLLPAYQRQQGVDLLTSGEVIAAVEPPAGP